MATLQELVVKINADTEGFKKGISGISDTLGKIGKVAGVAAAATATALAGVGVAAAQSYADYEQLTGGVETLFKDSSDTVMKYANDAYKTAGLSANEYMETITGFSASLLQGLGGDTEAAAQYANTAITDMADNANKMGTSMESIQNAYQGFAKQNYTMLDNLKLGYGGTKSEMERLLADAEAISGIHYDIANYSDVIAAIHTIQEQMGITGTTAKEAASTMSGSVSMMKSAWQNMLTGIADENADFQSLVSNFVDSITAVGNNFLPRIQQILTGLGQAISELVPPLLDMVITTLVDTLPSLLDATVNCLGTIIETLVNSIPQLIPVVIEALNTIITALVDNFDLLSDGILAIIALIPEIVIQVLPLIVEKLPDLIDGICDFIEKAIPQLIDAGLKLFVALVENLPGIIAAIVKAIPKIITSIVKGIRDSIPKMVEAGKDLLLGLATGIGNAVSAVVQKAKEAASKVLNGVKSFFGINSPSRVFAGIGGYLMEGLGEGIEDNEGYAISAMKGMSASLEDAFNPTLKANAVDMNYSGSIYSGNAADASWVDLLVSKLNSNSSTPTTLQLVCDGKVFGQTAINNINNITKSTGQLQLVF